MSRKTIPEVKYRVCDRCGADNRERGWRRRMSLRRDNDTHPSGEGPGRWSNYKPDQTVIDFCDKCAKSWDDFMDDFMDEFDA